MRSMTGAAVWFCGSLRTFRDCWFPVEIEFLPAPTLLPEALELSYVGVRRDSKSTCSQYCSTDRNSWLSSPNPAPALRTTVRGGSDIPLRTDILDHAVKVLCEGYHFFYAKVAAPVLPQTFDHLRKPGPASIT